MRIKSTELRQATLEAIYWWNRSEHYYHFYFFRANEIYQNKKMLRFFLNKVFEPFLKDYSVRRNISAGYKSVDHFFNELVRKGFFTSVENGDTSIIDKVSTKIKSSGKSTKNETKSLLSKIAFLLNPNDFSLYDTQSKTSLGNLIREDVKLKDLSNYKFYQERVEKLRRKLESENRFVLSGEILSDFEDTEAFRFFIANERAFQLRIIDKVLWIKGQKHGSRPISNDEYYNFLVMQ